jgi:alpha-glucosidase
LNGKRPFVLTRAGYCGIQRYAAVWTGDNVSTDEHMIAGVRLINSMGLTGISNAGYDVGGFAGDASPLLFARWIALGAFSPFFRSHSMVNSRDSEPWSFGEEVEDISRNYIKLRYRLMPYLYSVFYESTQNGLPVARSLAMDYTHDDKIYQGDYQNQYLFGPAILVAPAESYKEYVRLYLPEGKWYDLFSDKVFEGKSEHVYPLSKELLPLFVKAGSIIPMQSSVSSLMNEKPEETLSVHLYTGVDGSFVYYEDDGSTFENEAGAFYKRTLSYSQSQNSLTLSSVEGNYASHFKKLRLYVHGLNGKLNARLVGNSLESKAENYRFIEPISDFDPYHAPPTAPIELKHLNYVEVDLSIEEMVITW